jgi:hypothetical protein
MSSDEAAEDAEEPGHVSFIRMRASETFDGQDRVISRAAYDLQVRATAHSASCGHPGFVPDDYLEHLDGLSIETTITAVELCTVGMWERVGGGYRVLDWEAVEVCLDQVRQRRGEDPQALAWEREGEAKVQARMAKPIVVSPPCAACGNPSARVELVAPGQLPAGWEQWPSTVQGGIVRQHEPGQWYLLFQDIATDNGYGGSIDASQAGRIAQAFKPPLCYAQVHMAGFTTMQDSARTATLLTATGNGTCPSLGMVTAPAATARAWTRTGRREQSITDVPRLTISSV